MAGKTSVGELCVVLTASAENFDKVLSGAESRMTNFAAQISKPLNLARGIGGGLSDMLSAPFAALTTDVSRFAAAIPGMQEFAGLIDMRKHIDAVYNSIDRTMELSREANRLGVDPQFLRGLQAAAGPEAEAVEKGMLKFTRILGELQHGSEDLTRSGGSSAGKLFEKWGLSAEQFAGMNQQQAIMAIAAKYQSLGDRAAQAAFGFDMLGKGAAGAHNVLNAGPEAIDKWVNKVKELNIGTAEQIALSKAYKSVLKERSLEREGWEQMALERSGPMAIGSAKFGAGNLSGLEDMAGGVMNWLNMATGGKYRYRPEEVRKAMAADTSLGGSGRPFAFAEDFANAIGKTKTPEAEALDRALNFTHRIEEQTAALKDNADVLELRALKEAHAPKWAIDKAEIALSDKAMAAATKTLNDMTDAAEKQATVFGRSAGDAARLRAELDGVSKADIKRNKTADDRLSALRLGEELATPAEKAQQEFERLKGLFDEGRGPLNSQTYLRALRRLQAGLAPGESETQANTALAGSQEWAHAFTRGADNAKDIGGEQVEEQQKTNGLLADIKDVMKDLGRPQPLMIPPG